MEVHNKGKKRWWDSSTQWVKNDQRITGENAYQWKSDNFTMTALHNWVKKQLGKPNKCEFCGLIPDNPNLIHWANKSQEYKRDVTDWLRLCAKCHHKYDNKSERLWRTRRLRYGS